MSQKRPNPGQIDLSGGILRETALVFAIEKDNGVLRLDCMQADFVLTLRRQGRLWLAIGVFRHGDSKCVVFGQGKTKKSALDSALARPNLKVQLEFHGLPLVGVIS